MRTLVPGYPAVIDALRDAETVHTFARLHGGPARLLAAHAAGPRSLRARRAAPLCPSRQSVCRTRRQGMARQRVALRRARRMRGRDRARRRRGLRARRRPGARLAGGPRPGAAPLRRNAAAAHGDDGAQPVVPGAVSARAAGDDRPAAPRVRDRRRRVPRHDQLPQGRARARRPHHHGVAHLCGGDPHARGRDGTRRAPAPARRRADGHPQRDRRRGVESRDRRASRRAFRRGALRRRAAEQGGAAGALRPRRRAGGLRLRRREPADAAEGDGPPARGAAGAHRRAAHSSRSWGRATKRSKRDSSRRRPAIRDASLR